MESEKLKVEREKFYIKSMGCKSNQFEGSLITKNLIEYGYMPVANSAQADYYILNSCSVTHKSDNETLYLLRNIKHLHSNIKTVLTGCVAQIEKGKLLEYDYIDYVFGNDDKFRIGEFLSKNCQSVVTDIMNIDKFNYQTIEDVSKTRYSLKIQDGCDNRCAYCIIPFARGKSRSADAEFIKTEINRASDNGFKEVVLTGIHIGQWGKDIGKTFVDLIREIETTNIQRYRLGSLNPLEITPELLNILEQSEKFCPHFHLSLQSACNKTLKSMNRFYTVEYYLDQIEDIRSRFKNVFLGSDIIAGFVGESDEDFNITINNLNKSGLSKIHTFPYSVRKGTQAEKMDGHVPDDIKQKRADIIKEISHDKFEVFAKSNLESVRSVLIEKRPDKHTGRLKGVSDNYLNILIDNKSDSIYHNTIQSVRLKSIQGEKFFGEIV